MGDIGATVPILGTAHRVFGLLAVFATAANPGVTADLKRFLRLFIFLGTVALAVVLGYEVGGWIGGVVAFVWIMVTWAAVAACMITKDPKE
jgi:glucose-6-phosphate-specific signal transduction histidine kinase